MIRDEFLITYIQNTLNEIKSYVKQVIVLEPSKEEVADKKMSIVLRELIDANFKNVNVDGYSNLVHTLLPLTDSKENDKIRRTFILYYTGLYFDNINLLNKMLKEEIDFGYQLHALNLFYLDKNISSRFEEEEYIRIIKDSGRLFKNFNLTTKDLSKEEKELYVTRVVNILEERKEDLVIKKGYNYDIYNIFTKDVLDIFEDASYYYATTEQLQMISKQATRFDNKREDAIRRLNDLVQTTAFKEYFINNDLMFSLFTDDELQGMDYWVSSYFNRFSYTPEILNKAMDLFKKNRNAIRITDRLTFYTFMEIDNDILIKIYDSVDFIPDEEWIKLKAITMKPKSIIKRILKK